MGVFFLGFLGCCNGGLLYVLPRRRARNAAVSSHGVKIAKAAKASPFLLTASIFIA